MQKIPVTGLISTVYADDKYPVIDPLVGIDGLRNFSTISEMYNIPLERRRSGMVVGISEVSNNTVAYYKLKPEGGGGSIVWEVGSASNWDGFFTSNASYSLPIKYFISSETIEVPNNYQYLIYGDLTVGTGGSFNNYGRTIIINGELKTENDGTWSNYNTLLYVNLDNRLKYSASFSCNAGESIHVTHSLGVQDFTYTLREGYNYIQANIEIDSTNPDNEVIVTCAGTVSTGRINIMG